MTLLRAAIAAALLAGCPGPEVPPSPLPPEAPPSPPPPLQPITETDPDAPEEQARP